VRTPIVIISVILISAAGCTRTHTMGGRSAVRPAIDSTDLIPRVHFRTASAEVDRRERGAIEKNAGWVIDNSAAVLVLEGHCDERGSEELNLELGDRRARSVMEAMMARGVGPERLIVLSKGEGEPVDPGHDGGAWRKNRRVEFIMR
jgi:peptidoglycan-associated lipoprotein